MTRKLGIQNVAMHNTVSGANTITGSACKTYGYGQTGLP
jgi:hypothetical protein